MNGQSERQFLRTHPWLTFKPDLTHLSPRVWVLLGEAQSKCEHISGVPLKPKIAEALHRVYLAKGVLATTAIEGNTLTEDDVEKLMAGQLHLPPSQEYLGREIVNLLAAVHGLSKEVLTGNAKPITMETLTEYNRLVLDGLPLDEGVRPGEIRTYPVTVGRYRGAPAEDCRFLLTRLCDWLESEVPKELYPGTVTATAVTKAALAHLFLAWIHPFGDGNGRTARLLEFRILIEAGVPTPAAHLLSNHYNETRAEYYRRLDKASRSGGDVTEFLEYAAQGFVDQLKRQIEEIQHQQWMVAWRDYVYERFRADRTATSQRRRQLVLDLSWKGAPVSAKDLPAISADVAGAYGKKSSKTMTRDLNALLEMGLLEKTEKGYRAKVELILAFLPARRMIGK